jgi:segregation and condensation protein A
VTLTVSRGAEQNTEFPDHGRMPGSADRSGGGGFRVHLENFDGPFDLLLQLISRHKLDITEVSLSQVTDEFIAHIKAAGTAWDLDQTSQFVVVAATLLDLKAARLIPSGEVEDPEDLALLEARDLLFARLLQYRAFQRVAKYFAATLEAEGRRFPREVGIEPRPAATRGNHLDQSGPFGGPGGKGPGTKAGERVVAGPYACTRRKRS